MTKRNSRANVGNKDIHIVAWSSSGTGLADAVLHGSLRGADVTFKNGPVPNAEIQELVSRAKDKIFIFIDTDRYPLESLGRLVLPNGQITGDKVLYTSGGSLKNNGTLIANFCGLKGAMINSPVLIGKSNVFSKAYFGTDLAPNPLAAAVYSLLKNNVKFTPAESIVYDPEAEAVKADKKQLFLNYTFRLPGRYLFSGDFFRQLFKQDGLGKRNMVYRMLLVVFTAFTFLFMAYVSKDFGISGDEFVDHRHAEYVLDYFGKGDPAALNQPSTNLHFYGNSVQVITAALCRWFDIDSFYEFRHLICALIGALGIMFAGRIGTRLGGPLCGLLAIVIMFFTPRFFGHSMNNLKDIPFAVGYLVSLYYTVRLFDFFPRFRLRDMIGLTLGIALTLGTRSGGLILYPMLLMYGGLFYLLDLFNGQIHGKKPAAKAFINIAAVIISVGLVSYCLSISLWPFALQKPLVNVLVSLREFTNYEIGLWTLFEGTQVISNNLPWYYGPKYLMIGMPLIAVIGFAGYIILAPFRYRKFNLVQFFLFFAAIFPVFWVIYQNSNLYGGIRHLLFVMPPIVALAAYFWSVVLASRHKGVKIGGAVAVAGLISLPAAHYIRNHPNEYVYFNELAGGMKGAYGQYDTDYYYNSLKADADWLKKNISLPRSQEVIIATNNLEAVKYYFRRYHNVKVVYSRYYHQFFVDWDYSIYANVYIDKSHLQKGLFPPPEAIHTETVDGYPVSYVGKRRTKEELAIMKLENEGDIKGAISGFEEYLKKYGDNEAVWERLAGLYIKDKQWQKAEYYTLKILNDRPENVNALGFLALVEMKKGDYNRAAALINRLGSLNSHPGIFFWFKATLLKRLGQYDEAVKLLEMFYGSKNPPVTKKLYVLTGEIFMESGRYKEAAMVYQRLLKDYENPEYVLGMAEAIWRGENHEYADAILKAIERQPQDEITTLKIKALRLLMEGKTDERQKVLEEIEKQHPDPDLEPYE